MNAPLFDDAAPGGAGAGVNGPSDAHNFTRLPLTRTSGDRNAPAGTSDVAAASDRRPRGQATRRRAGGDREGGARAGATDAEIEGATGTQRPIRFSAPG